jgi:hypothetical protein
MTTIPSKYYNTKKQLGNVEYFNYLSSLITNDASCTYEIKSRIAMANTAFNKKTLFTSKWDLNLRKNLVECHTWCMSMNGAGKG